VLGNADVDQAEQKRFGAGAADANAVRSRRAGRPGEEDRGEQRRRESC